PLNESDKVNFGTVEVTFQRLPKPAVVPVEQTQADTVSINGFEFSSKAAEPPASDNAPNPPTEKAIDSPDPVALDQAEVPMPKTVASNEILLNAIEIPTPRPVEPVKVPAPESAPKATQDRIEFDFSEQKEGEAKK
ncbi:MAG: hypothetical protein ACRD43_06125, partial [Pyrinomonadaceae bacterium]